MKSFDKTLQALKDELLFVREDRLPPTGRLESSIVSRRLAKVPSGMRFCVPRDGRCADEVCSDKLPFRGRAVTFL